MMPRILCRLLDACHDMPRYFHDCNRRKSVPFFDTQLPIAQCPCPACAPARMVCVSPSRQQYVLYVCVRCFQPPDNGGLAIAVSSFLLFKQ